MNRLVSSPPAVPLGEIAQVNPAIPRLLPSEEVAFVPMASVSEQGSIAAQTSLVSELKPGFSYFQNGDILVAKITPCYENNKIAVARFPQTHGFGSTEFHVLRPNAAALDMSYLAHFLRQDSVRRSGERRMTGSAGQRRVPRQFLEELSIPLPPLDEQRRIAAILDQADDLRRKRRAALNNLEQLTRADFNTTFVQADAADWKELPIADLAVSIRTGPFGSQLLHSEFTDEGVAVLGIDNAVNNSFSWGQRRYINLSKFRELQRYRVHPRDVLVTIMGTCGRAAIVPDDIPLSVNTKHLCCLTLDQSLCIPEFLHAALLLHPSLLHQLGVSERGAVMPGLNMGLIKEARLRLPPIDLQSAFAARVAEIDTLKATHRTHLAKLDGLFASLQHRAFRGEL